MFKTRQSVFVFHSRLLPLLLLCVGLLSSLTVRGADGQTPQQEETMSRPVRILFDDAPSVDQVGFLLAKEYGFFQDAGFPDVHFVWNGGSIDGLKAFRDRKIDFAAFWMSEGIVARAKNTPIVALALICQGSTACFITRKDVDPGLVDIKSLQGRWVSVWVSCRHTPQAFLTSRDIECNYINQRSNVAMLLTNGGADAIFSTSYDFAVMGQYLTFRNSIQVMMFSDHECNYPELSLFCHEDILHAHPELCRRFVLAAWKGWKLAFDDPEKAISTLSKYCVLEGSLHDDFIMREQLKAWQKAMKFNPVLEKNGHCSRDRFDSLCQDMVKAKLIAKEECPQFHSMFFPILNQTVFSRLTRKKSAQKSVHAEKEADK